MTAIAVHPEMSDLEDVYGHLLNDWSSGKGVTEVIERDDGLVVAEQGCILYFSPFRRWPAPERDAVELVRGHVLDVGCGPGRVALHLQSLGHRVTAIDESPLTIELARARGVEDARVLRLDEIGPDAGCFDTVVMFGDNFGLLRNRTVAPRVLRRLAAATAPDARILAATRDIHQTEDPVQLAYLDRNRSRGRMPGQLRVRIRYRHYRTRWFDHLMVSREEMADLARSGGWELTGTVGDGPYYVGVLEKQDRPT
jgi:SAM-dependent methyltransferase